MLLTKKFSADDNNKYNDNHNVLLRLNSTAILEKKEIVDHFKILFNQLLAMGFTPRIINNCFRLHRFMTLADAVNLLIKDNGKYVHRFIEKEYFNDNINNKNICDLCEEPIENHIEHIDQNAIMERNMTLQRIASKIISVTKKISKDENIVEEKKATLIELKEIKDDPNVVILAIKTIELKNCHICLEEFDWANTDEKYKFECGHPYCPSCIDYHIETEIMNGRVQKIICPYKNCDFEIVGSHLKVIIGDKNKDKELFEKYLKFIKNKEVEDDPNMIFCTHPNCEGYIYYENREERVATIIKCQFDHDICTRCGQVWHAEKMCEKQLDDEIQKLVIDHKIRLKRCPGCANWTEKNLGCNHMTCVFCKFQWCWLCNQKYFPNHYKIRTTNCYGKQYPVDGQFEWEDYDPKEYEKARLAVNDPDPHFGEENLNNNVYVNPVIIPVEPRVMSTLNYFEELSPYYYKYKPDGESDAIGNIVSDCVIFLLLVIVNFLGNTFMLINLWKNEVYIGINNVFSSNNFARLLYLLTCFILWVIYFITIIGSTIVEFSIYLANSFIHNSKACYIRN